LPIRLRVAGWLMPGASWLKLARTTACVQAPARWYAGSRHSGLAGSAASWCMSVRVTAWHARSVHLRAGRFETGALGAHAAEDVPGVEVELFCTCMALMSSCMR
jgi:hypothetical protein